MSMLSQAVMTSTITVASATATVKPLMGHRVQRVQRHTP